MPSSGRATYHGKLIGLVDETYFDGLYGGYYFSAVTGTVSLDVDFATRTATASLAISIDDYSTETFIGTFSSSTFLLPAGVNGFSGMIDSTQTGINSADGFFTGTTASEAIGRFALPVMVNGEPHQVMGAWIAKTN